MRRAPSGAPMPVSDASRTGPRCLLIDGYNVIRRMPALRAAEAESLAAGRAALLSLLIGQYRHTPHCVLVVFDGHGATQTVQPLRCGVGSKVIFTPVGETADATIVRLAEQQRGGWDDVVVVSNDVAVLQGGAGQGAVGARVPELERRLNTAPRHLERRALHHAAVRRLLEAADDEAERGRRARKGNGHRAPRARRGGPPTPLV
jgi:uncharacterized protein